MLSVWCSTDCGAGVGRVSENLLLRFFQEVDLVEPSAHLIEEARRKLTGSSVPRAVGRAVGFFQMGLQDMHFPQPRWAHQSLLSIGTVVSGTSAHRLCSHR